MIKFFTSHPRLFCAFLAGFITFVFLPSALALLTITRLIISWDVTALLYLLLAAFMIMHTTHEKMRLRAKKQNEGKYVLLLITILSSWAFTQMMFALHYAHSFYTSIDQHQDGGLSFPNQPLPDYIDFLYFACVIGTSGQTADVSFTNQSMRKIGLIHCVLAFFFNTSLVALMINIASGLI